MIIFYSTVLASGIITLQAVIPTNNNNNIKWENKTVALKTCFWYLGPWNLTLPFFWLKCLYQDRKERSYICTSVVFDLSLSAMFLLDVEAVPTVWYFSVLHFNIIWIICILYSWKVNLLRISRLYKGFCK